MKVTHLSTFSHGGAGIAAFRLHNGLIEANLPSSFVSMADFGVRPYTVLGSQKLYRYLSPVLSVFQKYRIARDSRFELFSTPFSRLDVWKHRAVQEADIIHLHWIAEFVDWSSFFQHNRHKKFVLTLHDMFPFTGGCHHADECTRYRNGCDFCPQLVKSKKERLIKELFAIKEEALSHLTDDQLVVVGVSRWITELSQSSRLLGRFRHVTLPNPIDETLFCYAPSQQAKELLSPASGRHTGTAPTRRMPFAPTILFSAPDLNNPRKGFQLLLEALSQLAYRDNIRLIALGNKPKNRNVDLFKNIEFTGYIASQEQLNHHYNTADLFVSASQIESFGLTVAESLLAGTPVVAFAVGGIKEMIDNGKNGYTASAVTPKDLAVAIEQALSTQFDREAIARNAALRFGKHAVIPQYIELYNRLSEEQS